MYLHDKLYIFKSSFIYLNIYVHLNIKDNINMSKSWTPNQILKLYRSAKTKTALLNEEGKSIPLATREKRGAYDVRVWHNGSVVF